MPYPYAGQSEGGHRIQKAGGKTPKSAVAQAGVVLTLFKVFKLIAEILHRALQVLFEPQVDHGIAQRASNEKLQGQVVHALGLARVVALLGRDPALDQPVADREGQGIEEVARRCAVLVLGQRELEIVDD